jgi:hypothetical protein
MKRMYEGASAISVLFFLIIVVGGFLFGTKTHIEKSKNKQKIEKKVSKSEKRDAERYNSTIREMDDSNRKTVQDLEAELEHLRKMNDPLWHYYDENSDSYVPIPGKYNQDTPRIPRVAHVL